MVRRRSLAAFFTLVALLFSQLAIAAHACSLQERAAAGESSPQHTCCQDDASSGDLPGVNGVCIEHCHGSAARDSGSSPLVAPLVAAGPALRVALVQPALVIDAGPGARSLPGVASPPIPILFGSLRI